MVDFGLSTPCVRSLMPTYQEQLDAARAKKEREKMSEAGRAVLALAELGKLEEGLGILYRDGIITSETKFEYFKSFIKKHPEIEAALKRRELVNGAG